MANLFDHLSGYLKGISAVNALVGAGTAARIFPSPRQNVTLPYIVIDILRGEKSHTLSAASALDSNRAIISHYDDDLNDAWTLAEAVRNAPLDRYRGTMSDGSTNINVQDVIAEDSYEYDYVSPLGGGEPDRWRIDADYIIWHRI